MSKDEWEIKERKNRIKEEVGWLATDITNLFAEAATEEETQSVCNALCRMLSLIRETQNIRIDINKISKEIQEALMHGK